MNIDKIKNSIGIDLFNFINCLDASQLIKMRNDLIIDIELFGPILDYQTNLRRSNELILLNIKLSL